MPETFAAQIKRFKDLTAEKADLVVRKVAFDALGSVVAGKPVGAGTPVDTGRARNAWHVVIGSSTAIQPDPEPEPGQAYDRTGQAVLNRGAVVLAKVKAGDVVTLLNNVHYALRLEHGHSQQAPNGMVRVFIAAYPLVVKRAAQDAQT